MLVRLCLLSGCEALSIALQAASLAYCISEIWTGRTLEAILPGIAVFLAGLFMRQAVCYRRAYIAETFSNSTTTALRIKLADSIYELGHRAISKYGSALLTSTLIEGIEQIRTYLSIHLPRIADLFVIPITLTIFLFTVDMVSGIIALLILPCIIFYMKMLGSLAKEEASKKLGSFQRMANHFNDSFRGMKTIKVFGMGNKISRDIFQTSERFREATVKTMKTATLSSLVLDLFRVFALAAVAILLGFRLMAGTVTLYAALTILIVIPELFAAVRRYATDFHANLDGCNQLKAIIDIINAHSNADSPEATQSKSSFIVIKDARLSFEVNNVSFSYPQTTKNAISNMNFNVDFPMKVGIIGNSGSGKSTVANLLAGFTSPTSGSFTINGYQIETLDCAEWRSKVIYIPQYPHLFHGTLAENIAFYAPNSTDSTIARAADQAGLGSLIEELPDGLNTIIGEAGRSISGGQAQRVALARAFLCPDRPILIFDEPTAHLDIETEATLKPTMLSLMENRLVFFATHRLHWLESMDMVINLSSIDNTQVFPAFDTREVGNEPK